MLKKSHAFIFFILVILSMNLTALAAPIFLYQTSENWLSLSSVKTFFDLLLIENKLIKDLSTLQGSNDYSGSTLIIPLTGKLNNKEISYVLSFQQTGKLIIYPATPNANNLNEELFSKLDRSSLDLALDHLTYTEFSSGYIFNENIASTINTDRTREVLVTILREINPTYLHRADQQIQDRVREIEKLVEDTISKRSVAEKDKAREIQAELSSLLQETKAIQSNGSGKIWALNSLKLEVENQIELYKATAFESLPVESRGIWISAKAIPKTRTGISEMVKNIADAGFNLILPEVFSHGYTIYPSLVANEHGIEKQNPNYLNFDPLEILVEESKKHGIEIHPWFSVFYVGLNTTEPILSKYPGWTAVNKDGSIGYKREGNHLYFASPLSEGFREYVTDLMAEVAKYGVDGIHLDYVRYSGMDVPETDFSEDAVTSFKERYGLMPDERRTQAPTLWIYYRSSGVDQFVEMASRKVKGVNPTIYVSAAVAPDGPPTSWQRNYLQNWPLWLENGYVDFVIPMTYSPNPANVAGWFSSAVKKAPTSSQVFAGVSGFNLYSRLSLNNQVTQLGRTSGSLGSFFFAYDHFDLQGLKVLRAGVFSQDAVPAHRLYSDDWELLVSYLKEKVAKTKSALSTDAFNVLSNEYEKLELTTSSITSLQGYLSTLNQVKYLLSLVNQPAFSGSQIKGDLQMLETWLLAFGRKGINQSEVYAEIEACLKRLEELAPGTMFYLIPQYLYENKVFDISFNNEVNKLLKAQTQDPIYRNNNNLKAVLEKLTFTTLLLQGGTN